MFGPLQKTASVFFCSFYSYIKPTEALSIDLITTAFPPAADETMPPQASKKLLHLNPETYAIFHGIADLGISTEEIQIFNELIPELEDYLKSCQMT